MKSSRLVSAQCRSSNARTTGFVSARRSKKAARRRRDPGGRSASPPPARAGAPVVARRTSAPPDRACVPRASPRAFARGRRVLVLADAAAHPDHVRERPVRDALAVGKAAPTVPPDRVDDPVEVLVELPRQARLADPGDPGHRNEMGPPFRRAAVEELLDQLQLALAPDERRFEPCRAQCSAHSGDDPKRFPEPQRLGFAFEVVVAGALVDDCLLGRASRRLADEDGARLGRRLDAGGGVYQVACDHPFAVGADRDRGLAGQHARARAKSRIQVREPTRRARGPPARPARSRSRSRPAFPRRPSRRRR